jgi:undecaprenyl-diphosphatase
MGSEEKADVEALIRKYPQTAARPEARDQWLLLSPHPPFFSSVFNSFPSGHTNAAFVLAAFLTVLYPRLAWLWILWAVGCGLGRIEGRMHYPEDVLFGGATGWIVASVVFSWRWPARLGRRTASRFSG